MITVVVELGATKAFASALDWPGWSRSGKGEAAALGQLAACAPRYQQVATHAGHPVPGLGQTGELAVDAFAVVERIEGDATTDYGAPGKPSQAESAPLDAAAAYLRVALLRSCWELLDEVVEQAPEVLRKGPRGGGRDRDAVFRHVCQAELAYARKLGVSRQALSSVANTRLAIAEALAEPSDGSPLGGRGWNPRYGGRRVAWHVLDHAWEIEDRSGA